MQRDNLTREEAEARAALVHDLRYDVALDLTTAQESDTYRCDTVVRFGCREPGVATFLDLVARSVEEAELNGTALPAGAFDGTRLHVDGLAEENELRIRARCDYSHSGVGMHRFRDPVDGLTYLFTDCEPFDAHKVFPSFDQPDLKGSFRFSVLAPEGWEVASNMAPRGEPGEAQGEGGPARRWDFPETPPISAYVSALVAGPYHVVRDRHGEIDLGIICRRSMAPYLEPEEVFEITRQGLDFFQEAFAYPYAFGKYDQAFVPEFNSGAMENPGLVTFNESYIFRSKVTEASRERRAETILHEMAHMWFGDLVTMRWWDDLWLNESFATFMAILAQARATRFTNAWVTFANSEKTWAYQQDQLPSTHPIVADVPDLESVHVNFDGITYAKGASVLRQLVAWVGADAFLEGLRTYFRHHEFGSTDLADFLSALEETSGRDLRAWSKEWLETAGLNTLRAAFEAAGEDGGATFASFTVAQEAPEEWPILRPHRVTVGLYDRSDRGLVRRRRLELDVVGAATPVPELVGEPVPDLVLVNDEDLAYAKIRLDARSLDTVVRRLADLSDPLARAICWGACWEMVRDAEMPARDYLRLVLGNITAEEDVGVVQRIVAQARTAVQQYGDPANAGAALDTLATASRAALDRAVPGSDHQLVWARSFVAAARSPEHVADVRGLLDGIVTFEGLTVDTDLRWHIVESLASGGQAEDALIAAEVERDPGDQGRRHAASARAARPTEEAKAEAWEAIVTDTSLATATVNALIKGFQQPLQHDLLRPYAPRYFAALKWVWDERDLEVALSFTRGMYPFGVIDPETVEMTDRHLAADGSLPSPVRRLLLEGRDAILRSLRARARDAAAS